MLLSCVGGLPVNHRPGPEHFSLVFKLNMYFFLRGEGVVSSDIHIVELLK